MTNPTSEFLGPKYVPILKSKKGELDALKHINRSELTPLLEVLSPEKAAISIPKAWDFNQYPLWIQLFDDPEAENPNFPDTVHDFFNKLGPTALITPVLTVSEELETLQAYSGLSMVQSNGVTLRIDVEALIDPSVDIASYIDDTLHELGMRQKDVNLLVDGGFLEGTPIVQSTLAVQALQTLNIASWRMTVLAFSAFPFELGKVAQKSSTTAIPRDDAQAFTLTVQATEMTLIYSDYGVGNPSYSQAAFSPIPNLKYAAGSNWMIHRASSRSNPAPQIQSIASDIVSAPYYGGPSFSEADSKIDAIASASSGPGNATTHVEIGMNRHFHVVLDRLATLGVP